MSVKLRPRLRGGTESDAIRADREKLTAWFEGNGEPPWHALLPCFERELFDDWKAYKSSHPDAVPPEGGYDWLNDLAFNPDHGRMTDDEHRAYNIRFAAVRVGRDGTPDQHRRLMAYYESIDGDHVDDDDDEGVIDADPRRVAAAVLGRTPDATELADVFGVSNVTRREAALFVWTVAVGLSMCEIVDKQHDDE